MTPEAMTSATRTGPMTSGQRAAFDRDGYLIIRGALRPDEAAAAADVDRIDGPPRRDVEWPDPEGAIELTAEPGDAVFFDRRIWHARSPNYSARTRKAVFFGYTYRWAGIRDDIAPIRASGWLDRLSAVQRQLLGGAQDPSGDHAWGHDPATTPLYGWLKERGLLNPAHPPLRP